MIEQLKNITFLDNSLLAWLVACGIFIGTLGLTVILIKFFESRFKKFETKIHEAIVAQILADFRQRLFPISYIISLYVALEYVKLPPHVLAFISKATFVFISFFVLLFISDFIKVILLTPNKKRVTLPSGVVTVLRVLLWVAGSLFVLSNLGFNVNTFVTGLGIGGVAIALASQAILGDLFNYFVILFDKPFKKGDVIQIDTTLGTVEYIGIKSTRIRSVSGELLLISNTDLTKSRLSNYQVAEKRRNLSIIGVEYSTSKENLHAIPQILKDCVEKVVSDVKVEFSRVHFSEFGASSLNFELVYFVHSTDYVKYVSVVQEVNYLIIDEFNKREISFAFPSQTIYMDKNS